MVVAAVGTGVAPVARLSFASMRAETALRIVGREGDDDVGGVTVGVVEPEEDIFVLLNLNQIARSILVDVRDRCSANDNWSSALVNDSFIFEIPHRK